MCLPDVVALCPHVPPRSAQALTCLLQNADKLSTMCHDSLADQGLLNGGGDPRPNGGAPRRP